MLSEWKQNRDMLLYETGREVVILSEYNQRITRDKLLDRERKAIGYLSEWTGQTETNL
jgi:hypothetical protein